MKHPDFAVLTVSWELALRADGYADNTVKAYQENEHVRAVDFLALAAPPKPHWVSFLPIEVGGMAPLLTLIAVGPLRRFAGTIAYWRRQVPLPRRQGTCIYTHHVHRRGLHRLSGREPAGGGAGGDPAL